MKNGYVLSLLLFVVTIPFDRLSNSIFVFLLGLFWLLNLLLNKQFAFSWNKFLFLFVSIFLLQLLSVLYSENFKVAQYNIEKYLPLLLMPIFLSNNEVKNIKRSAVLKTFIASCLISFIISFILSLYKNYQINDLETIIPYLLFVNVTKNVGISHVYFGLFLSFTTLCLITNLSNHCRKRYATYFLISLCVACLLVVGAKMSITALILIIIVLIIRYSIKTKKIFRGLVIVFLVFLASGVSVYKIPFARDRFSTLIDPRNYFVGDNHWNSIGTRVSLSYCSFHLIKEKLLFGYGTGDVQEAVDRCLKENKFTTLEGMSAHNQYIQYALSTGLIGLIAFLLCLILPLKIALLSENLYYFNFLLLIALASLTESILGVNKGIVFYSFFNSFLAFNSPNRVSQLKKEKVC